MTNEMSVVAWVSSGDSIGQNPLASSPDRGRLVSDRGVGIDTHHALGPGRHAQDDRSGTPKRCPSPQPLLGCESSPAVMHSLLSSLR